MTNRQHRSNKHNPWSWHRIFLLFALTVIMILGLVVVGGGSAMWAECERNDTRRSVYLSHIVTSSAAKPDLLHQLMTAWQCDIPVSRLPPALVAFSMDLPRSCDSTLLSQLRLGAQGALGAGVLLVVASAGGYGGAISARSGPLALYIVVTVVTAVLELAAVGLLVYQKSQLDSLPGRLELLLAQPVADAEVAVEVVEGPGGILTGTGGILTAPGGILTAPGRVPTLGPRLASTGGERMTAGVAAGTAEWTEGVGGVSGVGGAGGTTDAVGRFTEGLQGTTGAEVEGEASSAEPPDPQTSASRGPAEPFASPAHEPPARPASDSGVRPKNAPTRPDAEVPPTSSNVTPESKPYPESGTEPIPASGQESASGQARIAVADPGQTPQPASELIEHNPKPFFESPVQQPVAEFPPSLREVVYALEPTTAPPEPVSVSAPEILASSPEPVASFPKPTPTSAPTPDLPRPEDPQPPRRDPQPRLPVARRRRTADSQDWRESDEDWEDHSDQVVAHWAPAATDCLLLGAEGNRSHCYVQLEHNLQRELTQSELLLDLMLAPLVCAFLACLLQLTTICAAWNMITDQLQGRRQRAQGGPERLSTPV